MKKFTALLLALAMLLPACASATDTVGSATSSQMISTVTPTAATTTAEPTIPTDTLTTVPATDDPVTAVTATDTPATATPTTDAPITDVPVTEPLTTPPQTTTKPPVTTEKPVTTAPHSHSYGAWTTVTAANCGTEGSEKRTCACGEAETRKIAATGNHRWTAWGETKAPTVSEEGEDTRTCVTCRTKDTRPTAKLEPTLYNLFQVDNASRVTLVSSTAGGFNDGETAASLFDSAPYTKLCTNNVGYTIEWKLDKAAMIYGYSIVTANDTQQYDRRPIAWTLEASANGKNWTTVSDVSNGNIPRENYYETLYAIEEGKYQYFRFTLKAPTEGMTQMSEITLYTDEVPQTRALENQFSADKLDDSANMTVGIDLVKRMIDDYYNRDTHRVGEQPGATGATTLWPATSFLEAVAEAYRACPDDPYIYSTYIDLLNNGLPGVYRVEDTITSTTGTYEVVYYNAVAYSTRDYYYDDDAWVCLQYLNAYDLLGDERYLELGEESLVFFWTGWDDKLGGGIYWDKTYQSKNTCANGPIAIAFLRAYELTGKKEYLDKGIRIYDWLRDVMLDNNLYHDAINIDGSINSWKAAYNQGTPMAAGALLYRITGDKKYLDETTAVWNATINHMFRGSGSNTTMNGNPIYRAWCIGWLVRGFEMYYIVDDAKKTTAMDKLLSVLEDERKTRNYTFDTYDIYGKYVRTDTITGYYDPYFCSGDWEERYEPGKNNPDVNLRNKTQVLQPSGVATTFLLAGFYELTLQ